MMLDKKDFKKALTEAIIMEKFNKASEGIYDTEYLTNLITKDFSYRKQIVLSVLKDITGAKIYDDVDDIIYVEHPDNYQELDRLITKSSGAISKSLKNQFYKNLITQARGITITPEGVTSVAEEHDLEVPAVLSQIGLVIIGLKADRFEINDNTYLVADSPFWTLVHEVFHNHPVRDKDEHRVQLKTFNWILDHGYHDILGKLFSEQYLYYYAENVRNNPYLIINEIRDKLLKTAPELFYSFLIATQEIGNVIYKSFGTGEANTKLDKINEQITKDMESVESLY